MKYTIEATNSNENGEALDTFIWGIRKTEKSALSYAEKLIKKKEVFSVWVHSYSDDEDDIDFINQWIKYKGDSKFRKVANF